MITAKRTFQKHGDERGQLIALEEGKEIPFLVKRVYYLYATAKDVVRGKHAHRSLEQVLICVHGKCKIRLDDGATSEEIVLDRPFEGIYIANNIWREMYDFSEDAVLLVLASKHYDEGDYIRDYGEFLEYISLQTGENVNVRD